eukprot:gnl/TRDRNA2_/TRDRNA2_144984_c2_seq1.p1 gnl/TRDRNA2_/TRDRNA2_144984_c2~~gnl/TRDRNA2_/TRDRNA2_144984_c2_seq1.p1  ORF type:complete len:104 (-),score=5.74 gnl/TRDRNA2_/TRDRNA2_144984_c2_seq1:236-547(-)
MYCLAEGLCQRGMIIYNRHKITTCVNLKPAIISGMGDVGLVPGWMTKPHFVCMEAVRHYQSTPAPHSHADHHPMSKRTCTRSWTSLELENLVEVRRDAFSSDF